MNFEKTAEAFVGGGGGSVFPDHWYKATFLISSIAACYVPLCRIEMPSDGAAIAGWQCMATVSPEECGRSYSKLNVVHVTSIMQWPDLCDKVEARYCMLIIWMSFLSPGPLPSLPEVVWNQG